MTQAEPKRSLTGIQPSGTPHVGNLLGAILPALELSKTHQSYYFIASFHALTTIRDREQMRQSILDVAATWLAFGLDPNKTVLWNQHDVPEVCELAWILGCLWSKGMMDKSHAFKAAVQSGKKDVSVGLYTYPVLMAADILAYDAHVVPVGQDQKQHLEMTRDIAGRFNHIYGDTLVVPEPLIKKSVAAVPGVDGEKMSKSYGNGIEIFMPTKKLRKRVMAIQTDSKGMEDAKDPDTCTVFALHKLFATPDQSADLAGRYRAGGLGYGHAKQELFELMEARFAEPRDRYLQLQSNPAKVQEILAAGAVQARSTARSTLARVRDQIGL